MTLIWTLKKPSKLKKGLNQIDSIVTSYFKRLKGDDNPLVRDYVLPDYANVRFGYAKSHEESKGKPNDSEQVVFGDIFFLIISI